MRTFEKCFLITTVGSNTRTYLLPKSTSGLDPSHWSGTVLEKPRNLVAASRQSVRCWCVYEVCRDNSDSWINDPGGIACFRNS